MTKRWLVTAFGQDRPGLVAGVTQVLYQLGCNLEDSAMTRLEGEFTIMLICSSPSAFTLERLTRAFAPLQRRLRLVIHVKPLTRRESLAPKRRGRPYLISVYGADRPGIVARISDVLARAGVNITDVHTHRSAAGAGSREPSLYLLILEVELPAKRARSSLESRLKEAAKRLGVEVGLRPSEAVVL